ncbi:hypothetical protein BDY21DRAFT_66528 [Lineolata rhizophorae]|uniref:Uncharacterized protein n=1 Tax=Lineolata rhizophorae TaxID=578093 RepID=A0A6A6NUV0_9PEZI|nr:hypothetical protein BDY21DRAFT_66528 [Lineolata rhizophorae]
MARLERRLSIGARRGLQGLHPSTLALLRAGLAPPQAGGFETSPFAAVPANGRRHPATRPSPKFRISSLWCPRMARTAAMPNARMETPAHDDSFFRPLCGASPPWRASGCTVPCSWTGCLQSLDLRENRPGSLKPLVLPGHKWHLLPPSRWNFSPSLFSSWLTFIPVPLGLPFCSYLVLLLLLFLPVAEHDPP